jgi:phosphonate transport system substrate-binding protein
MISRVGIILVGACFIALATVGTAAHAQTFVFTAIPDEDESRLQARFDTVAKYLKDQLHVDTRYVPVKSYAAAVTAFRNNQVQLAWFGGLSGVRARQLVPGSEAIAQGAEDAAFITYFIAHASTGLRAESKDFPKAIQGKTFSFGEKGSTSGRLMPEFWIRRELRKAPEEVFSRVGFSGDHSRTIALVQSGSYEIGAVNYEVWNNELKAGNVDPQKIAVIWRTPPFPDYQWSIRGDVDRVWGDGFKERVKQTLLELRDPTILAAFPRSKFIPASNDDYQAILETAKAIGLMD